MKRTIIVALGLTMATGAMAGTLDITSDSYSSLYNYNTSTYLDQNPQTSTMNYSGMAMSGSVNTLANSQIERQYAQAANTVTGDIFSEGFGMLTMQDTLTVHTTTYGSVIDAQGSSQVYTFTTGSATTLALSFVTSITSSGYMSLPTPGQGLFNYELYVDGILYSPATSAPTTAGSFLIPLFAGSHQIESFGNANAGNAPAVGTDTMNETVYFETQAVPEPAPCAMLGLGLAGLLVRRRNTNRR